jgi:hypothetical protein
MTAPRPARLFSRLTARGASAQAAIAGGYAWAVTVAPVLWERGPRWVATAAACAAPVALLVVAADDRLWRGRGRTAALWVFVLASALSWLSAPAALRPARIDGPRGLAGMLGWALFAFACAGPAMGDAREGERVIDDAPLEARSRLARGDAVYPAVGAAAALALQFVGWQVASPERALLVRLVALGAGLAIVGASAEIALSRHLPRVVRGWRPRVRSARIPLLVLGLLATAGVLLASRG